MLCKVLRGCVKLVNGSVEITGTSFNISCMVVFDA